MEAVGIPGRSARDGPPNSGRRTYVRDELPELHTVSKGIGLSFASQGFLPDTVLFDIDQYKGSVMLQAEGLARVVLSLASLHILRDATVAAAILLGPHDVGVLRHGRAPSTVSARSGLPLSPMARVWEETALRSKPSPRVDEVRKFEDE